MTETTQDELAERYDVVVIGGGAAGLSGALALARARRSVLVVDGGEPRNAPADAVHNYLGRDGVPPEELLATGRAEVTGYGGSVVTARAVSILRREGPLESVSGGFDVELADGRVVRARRLLVTTGLVDELPDVPGVAQRWGRDVLHCPYCHGWEVQDEAIGVLATSPLAVEHALMWRQWSADITLFVQTVRDLEGQQQEQLAARGIAVVTGEVTELEVRDDRLAGVRLHSGQSIPVQALVVSPRLTARSDLLDSLGLHPVDVQLGEHVIGSRVDADPSGATAEPGVWIAGNVADPRAQVIGSAAAGLTAGAALNADLTSEETARAVTAARTPRPMALR